MPGILILMMIGACSEDDPVPACIDTSQIRSEVACITVYDPVCGCNDVTYSNECFAQIEGVTSWTPGPCGD